MSISSPQKYIIATALQTAQCNQVDAELLLSFVLNKDRAFIIAYPEYKLKQSQYALFLDYTKRRHDGEPIAYLTESKEFYGRDFIVTPDTLIPRPETEILIERALTIATHHITSHTKAPLIIADIGTGSGAIIVTIAAELISTHTDHQCGFIATDTSIDALEVAHKNASVLELSDQISFIHTDLLVPFINIAPLTRMLRIGASLLICANLPYVDSANKKHLLAQDESRSLAFEPADALWADAGGLALYKRFLTQLAKIYKAAPKASITALCEIDPAQEQLLIDMIHASFPDGRTSSSIKDVSGLQTQSHTDLSGRTRIIELTLLPTWQ